MKIQVRYKDKEEPSSGMDISALRPASAIKLLARITSELKIHSFSGGAFTENKRLELFAFVTSTGMGRSPDTIEQLDIVIEAGEDEGELAAGSFFSAVFDWLSQEGYLKELEARFQSNLNMRDPFAQQESLVDGQAKVQSSEWQRGESSTVIKQEKSGEPRPRSIAEIADSMDSVPYYLMKVANAPPFSSKQVFPIGTVVEIYRSKPDANSRYFGRVCSTMETARLIPDVENWKVVSRPEGYSPPQTLDQIQIDAGEFPFYARRIANVPDDNVRDIPIGTVVKISKMNKEQDRYIGALLPSGENLRFNTGLPLWVRTDRPAAAKPMANIIGMQNVKEKVHELLATYKLALTHSITNAAPRMVFAGAPGTGKTTVASAVAEGLASIGVIRSPDVRIVSGASLKGEFVGHTAPLINKLFDEVEQAGQLLLIDEVYSLFVGDGGSGAKMTEFAGDAIGILLLRIEGLKRGSGLILAGYPDKLFEFFKANPGMVNRMQDIVSFENYTPEESLQILFGNLKERKLLLSKPGDTKTEERVKAELMTLVTSLVKAPNYANGRTMRNLADHILRRLAVRLENMDANLEDLVIVESDFKGFRDSGAVLDTLSLREKC